MGACYSGLFTIYEYMTYNFKASLLHYELVSVPACPDTCEFTN
jgi:hypothetical protein